MKTSVQQQIQRLNQYVQEMKTYSNKDLIELIERPAPNNWSLIEIVGHLNLAYELYRDRMATLLEVLPSLTEPKDEMNINGIKGFLIRQQAPQNGQRKWKMKTFTNFQPVFDLKKMTNAEKEQIFSTFFNDMHHLKQLLLNSRTKDCSRGKLHSAIGSALKFTLPQAIVFNLNHIERHMLQMKETVQALNHKIERISD